MESFIKEKHLAVNRMYYMYYNPDEWEDSACDRSKWRLAIHKGAAEHEAKRSTETSYL